jgi:hypothetical protein
MTISSSKSNLIFNIILHKTPIIDTKIEIFNDSFLPLISAKGFIIRSPKNAPILYTD